MNQLKGRQSFGLKLERVGSNPTAALADVHSSLRSQRSRATDFTAGRRLASRSCSALETSVWTLRGNGAP